MDQIENIIGSAIGSTATGATGSNLAKQVEVQTVEGMIEQEADVLGLGQYAHSAAGRAIETTLASKFIDNVPADALGALAGAGVSGIAHHPTGQMGGPVGSAPSAHQAQNVLGGQGTGDLAQQAENLLGGQDTGALAQQVENFIGGQGAGNIADEIEKFIGGQH